MDQWLWMAYPLAMATKKWGKKNGYPLELEVAYPAHILRCIGNYL
jgi:endo-1,4-beta-D-glucanase Y